MWQSLTERTRDADFTVIAVALDEPEAVRPWIESARPDHPCLIDRGHRVAELYHLTNVPRRCGSTCTGAARRHDGREGEAQAAFSEASTLHPESWAIRRQSAGQNATGLAVGDAFWARVDALGSTPCHRPIDPDLAPAATP